MITSSEDYFANHERQTGGLIEILKEMNASSKSNAEYHGGFGPGCS